MDPAWASAIATFITAVIAIIAIRFNYLDGREATRPYMVAYLEPSKFFTYANLHVKNMGKTAAHNVNIVFPEGFAPGEPGGENMTAFTRKQLGDQTIQTWAPGWEVANHWVLADPDEGEWVPDESVEVQIKYDDGRKRILRRKPKSYSDTFVIDRRILNYQTYGNNTQEIQNRLKVINSTLVKIEKVLNPKK